VSFPAAILVANLPRQLADLAFELSAPCLARVVPNDGLDCLWRKGDLFIVQTVLPNLAGDEVVAPDDRLFLLGIATQLDDFHAVKQGERNPSNSLAVAMNKTSLKSNGTSI
jgi:hypothetical protein